MTKKDKSERNKLLEVYFRDNLSDMRDFSAIPEKEKAITDRSVGFAYYVFGNAWAEFREVFFAQTLVGKMAAWLNLIKRIS